MATKEGLSRGIACLIILGLLGIGWAGKKPSQQGKEQKGQKQSLEQTSNSMGPRIKVEEEEIILFDEKGKEIKREYVSKFGKEKEIILREIREKVLEKLRVKLIEEVSEKKLWGKYNEEIDKLIKIKALDRPKLKFIDKEGNIVKTILLAPPEKSEIREVKRQIHGSERLVKEATTKEAIVSKNNKYALITQYRYLLKVPEGLNDEGVKLKYYDTEGNMLWQRQTPKNMQISCVKISDDGEIVIYIQTYEIGGLDENEPYEKIIVCNKEGKELFKFPETRGKYRLYGDPDIPISSNGRYISVRGENEISNQQVNLFFDLQNKTFCEAPSKYYPYKIEDNGIAYTSYYDENEKKIKSEVIDLKKYLGK